MAIPQTVVDDLRDYLLNNVTNPHPDITEDDTQWVQTTEVEKTNEMPRVKLQQLDGRHEDIDITTTRLVFKRIQIDVWWNTSDYYRESDNKIVNKGAADAKLPMYGLDEFSKTIMNGIDTNQSRWKALDSNIHHFLTTNDRNIPASRNRLIRKMIEARLVYER